MRLPWNTKEEPGGVIGQPKDRQDELEMRLEKAERKLEKLHAITYGDKSKCYKSISMNYNGETHGFTFRSHPWFLLDDDVPVKMTQEEAMELAEFILDNYKENK